MITVPALNRRDISSGCADEPGYRFSSSLLTEINDDADHDGRYDQGDCHEVRSSHR